MAGLYLHIPFCCQRCIYCGFYSTTQLHRRQQYVDALCREWQLRRHELTESVETIYLGGGTPSQLTTAQLSSLLSALPTAQAREVTIECNPDDVSPTLAAQLPALGINRVSLGIQTFSDERLRFLRRRHDSRQAIKAVETLQQHGIQNISIDLMFGFPEQTLAQWRTDLSQVVQLGVQHVSAYSLAYEESTPLYNIRAREEITPCGEEEERTMYEELIDRLAAAGFEHYEISNFALPGRRSLHNSAYWHQVAYIGLGAAAHSYDTRRRSWNVSDIDRYIDSIAHDTLPSEGEAIVGATLYNDIITTALRTREGLDLSSLSEPFRSYCLAEAQRFLNDNLLQLDGQQLHLTRRGLFVSDMVMSSLIYCTE